MLLIILKRWIDLFKQEKTTIPWRSVLTRRFQQERVAFTFWWTRSNRLFARTRGRKQEAVTDMTRFYRRGDGEIEASRKRGGRIPRSSRADRKEGIPLLYSGG